MGKQELDETFDDDNETSYVYIRSFILRYHNRQSAGEHNLQSSTEY